MSKVIFSIHYEIPPAKKEAYFNVIRELKNLLKADGLESYSVYEIKGKANHFHEQYVFSSEQAYEDFDDNQNERINILISKLNDLTTDNSIKYTTLLEVTGIE